MLKRGHCKEPSKDEATRQKCYNCLNPGHKASECRSPFCRFCCQVNTGHTCAACPRKKAGLSPVQSTNKEQPRYQVKGVTNCSPSRTSKFKDYQCEFEDNFLVKKFNSNSNGQYPSAQNSEKCSTYRETGQHKV